MKCQTLIVAESSISRAPQGARGLKLLIAAVGLLALSRAPQGARGLKCKALPPITVLVKSRPARGAWIEMRSKLMRKQAKSVAPRKGRVD